MKTYNIDITINKNKKSSNPSIINNASAYIDNLILTNLKGTAPYLFGKNKRTTCIIDDDFILGNKSTAYIIDDDFIPMHDDKLKSGKVYSYDKNKKNTIDITIGSTKKTTRTCKSPDFLTFAKAVKHLLSKTGSDTYDFKLDDGTPVKMFSDELQIGYELFPLNEGTMYLYKTLSESRKKNIIDIYINI